MAGRLVDAKSNGATTRFRGLRNGGSWDGTVVSLAHCPEAISLACAIGVRGPHLLAAPLLAKLYFPKLLW